MDLLVFDLDGTLLNRDSRLSTYTQSVLSKLDQKSICYTVATGRSLQSAREVLQGHTFSLPQIYTNGVVIWQPETKTINPKNLLSTQDIAAVIEFAYQVNLCPFLSVIDHTMRHFIYHGPLMNDAENRLLAVFKKRSDCEIIPISQMPSHSQVISASFLGAVSAIERVKLELRFHDTLVAYSGAAIEGNNLHWMDIHHNQSTKGRAVMQLKTQLQASRIICFGDNDNDLSMFEVADEAYAPNNAIDSVKAASTAVVGHHDEDGIARFLSERYELD